MRSSWIQGGFRVGPKSNDSQEKGEGHLRSKDTETQGGGHVEEEAETAALYLQATEH